MQITAFYLPQFHPIPENDTIYGKGFTEWDNVRQARPLFSGHCQPRVPHPAIGYYSLLDESFLVRQHALARAYGVESFCYYYYNINGRRVLEKPVDLIVKNREIKNGFCLCWDHQSWYNNRIFPRERPFLEQVYSRENALGVFHDLEKYFASERYLQIDGKPLFLVFAPERCPEIRMYADIWHEEALRLGLPGICLAGVQAYVGCAPELFNFDCMVEFAPNWRSEDMACVENGLRCFDYRKTVAFMLSKPVPEYHSMRCVFPAWDNTPRRGAEGVATKNSSRAQFRLYLSQIMDYTARILPANMQHVFLNSWNEWGEGCQVEPDERYGFTWLEIIREQLAKHRQNSGQ